MGGDPHRPHLLHLLCTVSCCLVGEGGADQDHGSSIHPCRAGLYLYAVSTGRANFMVQVQVRVQRLWKNECAVWSKEVKPGSV